MKTKNKKIGIAVIHGMGDQPEEFSESFIQDIVSYYDEGDGGFDSRELHFESVYWADILNGQESELWENLDLGNLHFDKYRKFIVNYFGDAVAYQKMYDLKKARSRNDLTVYYKVQNKISASLERISRNTEKGSPLVLIGHSLGCVMLMNYIYDSQKSPERKKAGNWKSKCEPDFLAGLFTCGNPFALWSLRKENFGDVICFPGKKLTAEIAEISAWYNIYDPDDILAFPIKHLNESYRNSQKLTDLQVDVDEILLGHTPLSHLGYFTTLSIIKLISNFLRELRTALK
ncbi:MAG: hypothetical protein JSS91_10750 [Bacteroidetes bacterium]|nr:hypothetical protein [Bacteroidota bacterium]